MILSVFWLLGVLESFTVGGYIHILLGMSLAVVVIQFIPKSERFGAREATIQRIIPVTRTTRESTEALAGFGELTPGTKCEENMYGWVQRLTGIVRQRLWLSLADGPLLTARCRQSCRTTLRRELLI